MRIATWNVNSIRSRIDRVEAWLERSDVDVLRDAGDQGQREAVPPRAVRGARLRGGAPRPQPVERRRRSSRASASRTSQVGFDGMPGWGDPAVPPRRARSGRPCDGVRVWSLYVPNGRALDDPHMRLQAGLAGARSPRRGRVARRRPRRADRPDAATGTSRRTDADVWSVEYYDGQDATSRPVSAPRSRASSTPASSTSCARTRRARASSPTGTTRSCASRSGRACASTSRSCSPAFAARVVGAAIDREERREGAGRPGARPGHRGPNGS